MSRQRKVPGHNPLFDKPRVQMIVGVKYVPTMFRVAERFEDGEPKTLEVMRSDDTNVMTDAQLAYAPETWSRGR